MQALRTPFETAGLDSVYDLDRYDGPPEKIWSLKIGWNKVEPYPKSLREMVNLQAVEIRGLTREDLVPLFEELAKLPRLRDLSFGLWPDERFPTALGKMKTLERMKFRCASYPTFPDFMRGMDHLLEIELDIDKWLGDEAHLAALGTLPRLQKLEITIRDNHPRGLRNLQQIKQLVVHRLEQALDGLGEMASLEELNLNYRWQEAGLTADLQGIESLNSLKNLRIQTWGRLVSASTWEQLQHLEQIDLSDCNLTQVPEVIGTLPHLKRLNLSNNRLQAVPDWFGELNMLEELNLPKNQLNRLPASFSRLKALKKIDLAKNKLISIPKVLLELPNVQHVLLADNRIEKYPKGQRECPALLQLDLRDNMLPQFPTELLALANAEILVKGNPFARQAGYKMEDVVQEVSKQTPPSPLRATLLALAIGDVALARKTATMAHILFALNHNQEKLRAYALVALSQMLENPFGQGPKPGNIAILGQSKGYPIWDFEKKLAVQGIELIQGKVGEADIVVIGERPGGKALGLLQAGSRVATMPQLAEFVASFEQPWLREKAAEIPKIGENFERLLYSKTPENLKIALEMMTAGGIPQDASLSEVVALSLLFPDSDIRKQATKFVNAKGSAELRAFLLANKRDLVSIGIEDLKEYVFRFLNFLGDDARGFAKMAFHINTELKDCFIPYMTGEELKAALVKKGVLSLSKWRTPVFPKKFHEIKRLKGLEINRYELKDLPKGLTQLKNLKRLNLAHNKFSQLPDDFRDLTELEHLSLRGNTFVEVPEVLKFLPKLAYIDLSFNPFRHLPAFLAEFPALKEIGIHHCVLSEFPVVLRELPLLEELSISFAKKKESVKEIVKEVLKMKGLKRLYIAKYHLEQLPDNLDLPLLESLRLDGSDGLTSLPDTLGNCIHLKVLDLEECTHLASLPGTIGNLAKLEDVNLRGTRIKQLPASFSKLKALKKLTLPSSNFTDSGGTIAILKQLPTLKEVDCTSHRNERFIRALETELSNCILRE